jgi:hypothetical protein
VVFFVVVSCDFILEGHRNNNPLLPKLIEGVTEQKRSVENEKYNA